ncbi:hypothetical protein GB931_00460 [Modestobacter sp. I12A-02628]|uniref:Uncharacterized protein n=1 Tax=Goekera deserti TaxID=2497753 RepID=A0A7K3WJP1_9ACTN|nr:hypothetical protein [Goekera deserti]MPQ96419.1 hypothetical protein [Goekera deserti]NDI47269.1 hypothetical protein [Goekera deserti]NEL56099.1 hypothetical protein [Goekera deserti]
MEWTIEQPRTQQEARLSAGRYVAAACWVALVAVVALVWSGHGAQALLGAVGVSTAAQGATLLRLARAGGPVRAPWLAATMVMAGVVTVFLALLPAVVAGWVLLAAVAVVPVVLAVRLPELGALPRALAVAVPVAVVAGVVLTSPGTAVRAVTVLLALGLAGAAVAFAVQARRFAVQAARPAPAAPAGCGGCACAAGGCGAARLG